MGAEQHRPVGGYAAGTPGGHQGGERLEPHHRLGSGRCRRSGYGAGPVPPDIVANIYRNPGEIPANGVDDDGNGFVDDVTGWDFGGDGQARRQQPQDPVTQGHGTSVAGTIGTVGNNGIGVVGVAWNVRSRR